MRVRLVPLEGGTPIEITKDLILVGRKEDCDVRIDHKSISKLHCVVVKTDGLLLLRDLGSTNGTRVNGQRGPPGRPACRTTSCRSPACATRCSSPRTNRPRPRTNTRNSWMGKELARLIEKADQPGRAGQRFGRGDPGRPHKRLPDHYPEAAPAKK